MSFRSKQTLYLFKFITYLIVVQSSTKHNMNISEDNNKDAAMQVASSLNQFSLEIYRELARNTDGNIFFSPFSISTVLAMIYMGTNGKTKEELMNVLHLPDGKDIVKNVYNDLMVNYKRINSDYELKTSNMIYISNEFSLLNDFHSTMTKDFLSDTKMVDFSNDEMVRSEINSRVENETNLKIKDLIPAGLLNSYTRMVLINAIYFKGFWQNKFDPKNTKELDFWIAANESIKTPMMYVEKKFVLSSLDHVGLDARRLSMDYEGSRLTMTILLPNKRDGLAEMEKKLSTLTFSTLMEGISSNKRSVKVTIPKFKLEESLNLVGTLREMGVYDLFDEHRADLSGISEENGLFVSNVIHKAFIEVNEEGTEAAAASAVMVVRLMFLPQPVVEEFVADHPFVFFIVDVTSGLILFTGKLTQPSP